MKYDNFIDISRLMKEMKKDARKIPFELYDNMSEFSLK